MSRRALRITKKKLRDLVNVVELAIALKLSNSVVGYQRIGQFDLTELGSELRH
jgi:hypothetical protein